MQKISKCANLLFQVCIANNNLGGQCLIVHSHIQAIFLQQIERQIDKNSKAKLKGSPQTK